MQAHRPLLSSRSAHNAFPRLPGKRVLRLMERPLRNLSRAETAAPGVTTPDAGPQGVSFSGWSGLGEAERYLREE